MINIALLTDMERRALARKFMSDIGLETFVSGAIISRDNFDLWIIDNGLAEDPGTDDVRSVSHKGFVQQRSQSRIALNRWAAKLPEGDSYAVEVDKERDGVYTITTWADNAFALAADIGNRVEKFTKNKVKGVRRTYNLAYTKAVDDENVEDLLDMVRQLDGHGIVMQKRIKAEVAKFNHAVEMVEKAVAARIAAPDGDAAVNT